MRRISRKHVLLPAQAKQVVFSHQAQYALVIDQLALTSQQCGQHSIASKTMMRDRQLLQTSAQQQIGLFWCSLLQIAIVARSAYLG
jgi:DNA-binding PucR family transcriptional regulator